jgi:hypothetical protein
MTKLDLDSYRQMSEQAVRRWLIGSCVAAGAVAAALLAMAGHHVGGGLPNETAAGGARSQVSAAAER